MFLLVNLVLSFTAKDLPAVMPKKWELIPEFLSNSIPAIADKPEPMTSSITTTLFTPSNKETSTHRYSSPLMSPTLWVFLIGTSFVLQKASTNVIDALSLEMSVSISARCFSFVSWLGSNNTVNFSSALSSSNFAPCISSNFFVMIGFRFVFAKLYSDFWLPRTSNFMTLTKDSASSYGRTYSILWEQAKHTEGEIGVISAVPRPAVEKDAGVGG